MNNACFFWLFSLRQPCLGLSLTHTDTLLLILFFLQVDALNHECPGTSVEASQVSVAHIPASPHVFTFLRVSRVAVTPENH